MNWNTCRWLAHAASLGRVAGLAEHRGAEALLVFHVMQAWQPEVRVRVAAGDLRARCASSHVVLRYGEDCRRLLRPRASSNRMGRAGDHDEALFASRVLWRGTQLPMMERVLKSSETTNQLINWLSPARPIVPAWQTVRDPDLRLQRFCRERARAALPTRRTVADGKILGESVTARLMPLQVLQQKCTATLRASGLIRESLLR